MFNDVYLKISMYLNCCLGLQETHFKTDLYNKLHRVYAGIWISAGIMQMCSHFYELKDIDNLNTLLDNLRIQFLILFSFIKYLRIKSKSSKDLVQQIRDNEREVLENCLDETEIGIFHERKNYNDKVTIFFMVYGFSTLSLFYLFPIVDQILYPIDVYFVVVDNKTIYTPRPFPFGGAFPFDTYKYYKTTYAFHIWFGIFTCGVSAIPDVFYWALMIFATYKLKILQYRVLNFKELAFKSKAKKNNVSFDTISNIKQDDLLIEYLGDCIQYHKDVIKYITDLNICVRYLILIDCIMASLLLAVIGFAIILSGFGFKQLAGVEYLTCIMTQSFCFYWYANEISLESLKLQYSIWESEWYECSIKVKKVLLFIQLKVQEPLVLYIGPFSPMSVSSALAILRTAMSYLTVMRQVYMNK